MTTQFAPLIAAPTPGAGSPTTRCDEDFRPANEPSLAAMTKKSIELLDDDRDGFFLQVESASIDKRDHASDLCGQIGETLQLDEALKVALAFQRKHPDTLVVETADHSHTSQIVGDTADTPGFYATVRDRGRRAAARLLRHRQDAARPEPHRRPRAGRGDRAAGVERDGRPRPDGPVLHADRARARLPPPGTLGALHLQPQLALDISVRRSRRRARSRPRRSPALECRVEPVRSQPSRARW